MRVMPYQWCVLVPHLLGTGGDKSLVCPQLSGDSGPHPLALRYETAARIRRSSISSGVGGPCLPSTSQESGRKPSPPVSACLAEARISSSVAP